jgi:hypothetical protein
MAAEVRKRADEARAREAETKAASAEDRAAAHTFEVVGRAPPGSRCYFCGKGGDVYLVRRRGDRETDQAHLDCAQKAWGESMHREDA